MCKRTVLTVCVLMLATNAFADDPVVSSVTTVVEGNEHITTVDVTFTFSDAEGDDCHVALFGHDAVTRQHYLSFLKTHPALVGSRVERNLMVGKCQNWPSESGDWRALR